MGKIGAIAITRELKKMGSRDGANASARFFKTGKGEYGFGDKFMGVTVPEQRKIAKRFVGLPLDQVSVLLKSKWHECRLTALIILVARYTKGNDTDKGRIARFYIEHKSRINNWDLVDISAPHILGNYTQGKDKDLLYLLARSTSLWDRRIAIVATYAFIRSGSYSDTLKIAKHLFADKHDLIHKAVGWMLREVGKKSPKDEEKFLNKYASIMPRTMLRYAIEKFPEDKRRRYMNMRNKK